MLKHLQCIAAQRRSLLSHMLVFYGQEIALCAARGRGADRVGRQRAVIGRRVSRALLSFRARARRVARQQHQHLRTA